jgi:Cu+-exporting ATPase
MTKNIIFQDSFLVSGIMCYDGCGATIQGALNNCLIQCQQENLLPSQTQLIIDAEPQALGVHRLFITIESTEPSLNKSNELIALHFKDSINSIGFEVINKIDKQKENSNHINWINILVNLLTIGVITILSVLFPPSIALTIGLTSLSFAATAFTARDYLINFFRNLQNMRFANMSTTITLGWLLSLVHTLYHSITMPLASSFSMIFMSFIMPVILITVINGMDEIKRLVLNKSIKMHIQGIKTLFPQMSEEYPCYQLLEDEQEILAHHPTENTELTHTNYDEFLLPLKRILANRNPIMERKNSIKKGMLVTINRGECFPVDCILIQGATLVDSSLLTGETQQSKKCLDFIPAGAVNLGQSITAYAIRDSYNSTVNKLLFRSNRAKEGNFAEPNRKFTYLYTSLVALGIIASIVTPFALGIFTIPLLLQNITGILFAVCPCTVAIAHQLPNLLNLYQRSNKGITIRDGVVCDQSEAIHTIVFDKTGTLTTGNSLVESSEGISASLWERIYLLEQHYGAEHPLAKAICHYYESSSNYQSIIQDIREASVDSKNRGLSAIVQGKQIHLGNSDYLEHCGIKLPLLDTDKIAKGFSPVYVAEDMVYQGVLYIKHEIRKDILPALTRFKKEGIKLIMLTGDNPLSAKGFNQQNGTIFDSKNILANQTPQDKEHYLKDLMTSKGVNPKGIWFVGDGLNDAPCARMVTEKDGVSCAMTSDDKAAFFTDISLNGRLDYLLEHNKLNLFLKKNTLQNQGLLIYGIVAFLTFIISFSLIGIAVSPIIPLIIMSSTTLFVLFNSYRMQLTIDNALDKNTLWLKQLVASDLSISLLAGSSALLICALLIATITTGGLAFPAIVFTAGLTAAISSACAIGGCALLGAFALLTTSYLFVDIYSNINSEDSLELSTKSPIKNNPYTSLNYPEKDEHISLELDSIFTLNRPTQKPIERHEIESQSTAQYSECRL